MSSQTTLLSPYERERQERIAKNHEAMRAVQLDLASLVSAASAAASAAVRTVASQRGLGKSSKATKKGVDTPRRRSSRLQGDAADGAYIDSETNGRVVLAR